MTEQSAVTLAVAIIVAVPSWVAAYASLRNLTKTSELHGLVNSKMEAALQAQRDLGNSEGRAEGLEAGRAEVKPKQR